MHIPRLTLKKRTGDSNLSLPAGKDLAAGKVECRVFDVAQKSGLAKSENHAPDARPVDGSRAHRARLGACVEGTGGEFSVRKQSGCGGTGKQFGMLRRISGGPKGIVAGLDDNRSSAINNQRAERMSSIVAGLASQFNRAVQEDFVNRGKSLRWHEVSRPYPASACQAPKQKIICKSKKTNGIIAC